MAEHSKIEWTHHTMNFWLGCTALSPACDNCYAESWAKRTGHPELWQGERRRTTNENWRKPLKWDANCALRGVRERVFTNSLADLFDNQVPRKWRDDAWSLIDATWHLDWMLLTKRPENIAKMLPAMNSQAQGNRPWKMPWPWNHVWIGTTVEDRARERRIDALRAIPAHVRFLSIEPLLEDLGELDLTGIHLVIVGGESGPHARPMHPDWVRSIRRQCDAADVAFFFKQWGSWKPICNMPEAEYDPLYRSNRVAREGENQDTLDELYGRTCTVATTAIGFGGATGFDAFKVVEGRGGMQMFHVGKARAGRLLDGREHNDMPRSAA